MSWIKVVLINLALTFCLIGMLLLLPPTIYFMYSLTSQSALSSAPIDKRAQLKIYDGYPWADKHFSELQKITTAYKDYITWRREDFEGETIKIANGIRKTIPAKNAQELKTNFYFFGGSTTWGTGVDDANTYPSIFAKLTESNVKNFGESAYLARQSLAYLNNLILDEKLNDMSKIHVVFYDGVNDVAHRCRSEVTGLATAREIQINERLNAVSANKYSFQETFSQLLNLLQSVLRRVIAAQPPNLLGDNFSLYNCATDPSRAHQIAQTLVETWRLTSDIVKNRGGEFTAILQPVSYIGNANVDYLELDAELKKQYQTVYPIVLELAAKEDFNFIDLTKIYSDCSDCYIDFCHVGPQAHDILAKELLRVLIF